MQYTPKQRRENRAQLVSALRSGDYKQIVGSLRKGDGMCGLGVACDVSKTGEWVLSTAIKDTQYYVYKVDGEVGRGGSMPVAVRDYYGFREMEGSYWNDHGIKSNLASNNDADMMTFSQLADIIESEPDEMFLCD